MASTARKLEDRLQHPWILAPWCVVAAFGTYACMYGFRKPFTAGSYRGDGSDLQMKSVLVTAQVLGYSLSKLLGIKVVSGMQPQHRARAILLLIAFAHLSLLAFAFIPAPWNAACMFLNGLPLGMVYGLVLGFLEGRRLTELFVAGQCASFILADGVTKSVGSLLLQAGVPEPWMPFLAGIAFAMPLVVFVWMLRRIPAPSQADVAARSQRTPMTAQDRRAMVRRHGIGLVALLMAYLLITVLRSVRADFAPEIWASLGAPAHAATFTYSEMWVALIIVVANGLLVMIPNNRRAFFTALAISLAGVALACIAIATSAAGQLPAFPFMVLLGVGLYVPYVAVHTTIFERLVAMTRERGNIGFLMYLADAAGYVAYAGLVLGRSALQIENDFAGFFRELCGWLLAGTATCLLLASFVYSRRPYGNSQVRGLDATGG
jgi:hypothetical protein